MPEHSGPGHYHIIDFIVDVGRTKKFHGGTLGLHPVSEEPPFAIAFEAHGLMLRPTR
jgi:hypothetical protein